MKKVIRGLNSRMIFLVKINFFSILWKFFGFTKYKCFLYNLQKNISANIKCHILCTEPNHFFIISQNDIKQSIHKAVQQYSINTKVCLSVQVYSSLFTKSIDGLEELKYSMLAQLESTYYTEDSSNKMFALYKAIYEKKLSLALQPIVDHFGEIFCYECLLRVNNHLFSCISEVIDISEKIDCIDVLDMQVLEMVIQLMRENLGVKFSMNISYNSIQDISWSKIFLQKIAKEQVSNNLILEITETGKKKDNATMMRFISDAHAIGISIAIDDFGTGYTSFAQLKLLKIDFVKIDALFIQDILFNKISIIFIEAVMKIAHQLNIKIIAEGVEDEDTAKQLINLNINYLQGYYFGKPCTKLS